MIDLAEYFSTSVMPNVLKEWKTLFNAYYQTLKETVEMTGQEFPITLNVMTFKRQTSKDRIPAILNPKSIVIIVFIMQILTPKKVFGHWFYIIHMLLRIYFYE